ncbi:MAG: fatty acid oxidation complex subunit alpha FadB [Alteromonadaceae bacterium]|nr:MAG: fatty acid oxidation complex subunit alpha FadB [Alteromonadaceae bacterium]
MLFEGKALGLRLIEHDLAELCFDLEGESINKFDLLALDELDQAITIVEKNEQIKGLLFSSAKNVFIVGADITSFSGMFALGGEKIRQFVDYVNAIFSRIENLTVPTLVAIDGYALGGGLEIGLACDFRLATERASIGLPETKLGIIPGWGGTVRLPRLAGLDIAIEWIASGKEYNAHEAMKAGVVDGVVASESLKKSAVTMLLRAANGKLDYQTRRAQKAGALLHNDIEGLLAFESSKAFIKGQAGRNYPAPVSAIKVMQNSAKLPFSEAIKHESASFVELAQTSVAKSLVGLFINDQIVSKKAKSLAKKADKTVEKAAVLGAGIMGGGIAYQSAYKGTPIVMKDIAQSGIDLGLSEATKLLSKRVDRGRMDHADMAAVLNRITPTMSYDGFGDIDIVVEAVVENPKVKGAVLAEVEAAISEDAILCSNTSTISIDLLAKSLSRPSNFCGMHFFNPVHRMPLVEVIRGKATSDAAVARTVAYAVALGKKPIVVNDCPGFLVNRILFPYLAGFAMLVRDGADYMKIDKVMERWGWPMGPAYLVDVVGMDTAVHAESVMADGFPGRMNKAFKAASDVLFEAGRLGQKNGKGFYDYVPDKKGKPQKLPSEEALALIKPHAAESREFSDEEIIARMMVPMAIELAMCLEEGVVASVAEADAALIYGIGFPPFRGGIFRWLDEIGMGAFFEMAKPLAELSPLYTPTAGMAQSLETGSVYYPVTKGE